MHSIFFFFFNHFFHLQVSICQNKFIQEIFYIQHDLRAWTVYIFACQADTSHKKFDYILKGDIPPADLLLIVLTMASEFIGMNIVYHKSILFSSIAYASKVAHLLTFLSTFKKTWQFSHINLTFNTDSSSVPTTFIFLRLPENLAPAMSI